MKSTSHPNKVSRQGIHKQKCSVCGEWILCGRMKLGRSVFPGGKCYSCRNKKKDK
jgi:hypothetical protein